MRAPRMFRRLSRRLTRNRRLRVLLFGIAELRGGPLDGRTRKVSRLAALGLDIPTWGSVLRRADGSCAEFWPWTTMPTFSETWPADEVWLGVYEYRFCADAFRWDATSCLSRTETMRMVDDA